MTQPNYWPYATLEVTVNKKQIIFVTDLGEAHLARVGPDLLELAKQIETGQVGKDIETIKSWIGAASNRNGYRMNFIDWDIVTGKDVSRIDGNADEQFHLDVTPGGTVIIAYNEFGKKSIRYKISTFKRIVNKAR